MKNILKILLATNNEHKLSEFRKILNPYGIEVLSLSDLELKSNVEEIGQTYKENAYLKAHDLLNKTKLIIMSDDSGIEIDALGEAKPGLYSARYAASFGSQKNANEYLVKEYLLSPARFYCYLCVLNLTAEPLYFKGIMEGHLSSSLEGSHGFGYDPIFVPNGYDKTISSLSEDEKNIISHRAKALNEFIDYLKKVNLLS